MTVVPFVKPLRAAKPKQATVSEVRRYYRQNSECRVTIGERALVRMDGSLAPDFLQIEFYGALALIPSLKNWKIPGTNFPNPDVTARLMAMTDLYLLACPRRIQYLSDPLWCAVILGRRPQRFDEDNGFAAVKDWLEPMTKNGKNRRWGIGITDNDFHVSGLALHSKKTGVETAHTTLLIRPFELVREPLLTFLARAQI